uniref:Diamine acetyltransferase 1 n=1 Tax=Chinchilla lanigera TaxID=34839 RepID=Q6QMY9_CHILA|nr:spermidine/spermine N1-acetyl transferase 1 [Chinchilla lanigera]
MAKFVIRPATAAGCSDILRLIKELAKYEYMEDQVMSDYRGFGIGSEILKNLSQVAMKCRCSSMHFLVAEWNEPSINFYKRRGASDLSSEEGWRLFKIDKEYLLKMAAEE